MSEERQTGSEQVTNQPVEPNAAVVDGTETVEPTSPASKAEVKTEEEILAEMQPTIEPVQKESRKTRAIQRSIEEFNSVHDENGAIDFSKLLPLVEKNPKGLETFAAANNYDLAELQREIDIEKAPYQNALEQKLQEYEDKEAERVRAETAETYNQKIRSLAVEHNVTLTDFHAKVGEDFNVYRIGLQAAGADPMEAIEKAFKKYAPQVQQDSEKDALLESQGAPAGQDVIPTDKIELTKAVEVYEWPEEKQREYRKKFRRPDGSIQYKK